MANRVLLNSVVNIVYPTALTTNGNKEFIEAGKARLDGDIVREATSDEVKELRLENIRLKEALADLVVRYDVVKKA